MLILYHTFMNLGRARSAWEGRLRPLIGAGFHGAISYSDSSVHIIFHQMPRLHAALCREGVPDLRIHCGSRLVNALAVWASPGVAYGILLHRTSCRSGR